MWKENKMKNCVKALLLTIVFTGSVVRSANAIDRATLHSWLNWSIGNSTGPDQLDCPGQYGAYPECIIGGGRACLMGKAIQSAKDGDCAKAFRLTLITQCHNGSAQAEIAGIGQQAVCDDLKAR